MQSSRVSLPESQAMGYRPNIQPEAGVSVRSRYSGRDTSLSQAGSELSLAKECENQVKPSRMLAQRRAETSEGRSFANYLLNGLCFVSFIQSAMAAPGNIASATPAVLANLTSPVNATLNNLTSTVTATMGTLAPNVDPEKQIQVLLKGMALLKEQVAELKETVADQSDGIYGLKNDVHYLMDLMEHLAPVAKASLGIALVPIIFAVVVFCCALFDGSPRRNPAPV